MVKHYIDFSCDGATGSWARREGYRLVDDVIARCIGDAMKEYTGRDDVRVVCRVESYENGLIMGTMDVFLGDDIAYSGIFAVHAVEMDDDVFELIDGWAEIYPAK